MNQRHEDQRHEDQRDRDSLGGEVDAPRTIVRPRDEFGRPLEPGEPTRLPLPDFDAMTVDEAHACALRFFAAGNYFGAHEAWETAWGRVKGASDEEVFKGLAQVGAGMTHWLRANPHGVVALLDRGLDRIGRLGPVFRGIDMAQFMARLVEVRDRAAAAERDGAALPPLAAFPVPMLSHGQEQG